MIKNESHSAYSVTGWSRSHLLAVKMRQNDRTASRLVIFLTMWLGCLGVFIQPSVANEAEAPLTIGEIVIQTNSIFSDDEVENTNGTLRFLRHGMNTLHFNTRHHVVRRELLFHTGDVYDAAQLAESERILRNLGFLNSVRVTPVDTTADGRVKVLVSTREAWTLRTSFSYSLASGGDQRWKVSASEGNFLGYGVTAGAGVGADEDSSFWNLWYRQRRLFKAGFWFGLDYSQRDDGHTRRLIFNRPFYALDDPWGMEFKVWNQEYGRRFYLSNGGEAGLDASNPDRLYALMDYKEVGAEARFQWRFSTEKIGRVWRLGGGLDVVDKLFREDLTQVEMSDDRFLDLSWLNQAGQPFARETGVEVNPFLWVHTQGRRWAKARFIRQYGPVEDIATEWTVDLKVGPTGGFVGSTTGLGESRWHGELWARRWFPVGQGFLVTEIAASGDAGSKAVQGYKYDGVVGWIHKSGAEMSPWVTRVFGEYAQGGNLLGSNALVLGLDRGLRTLDFDGMAGDHLVRWNVEQGKAMPWEVAGLVRVGAAVFYSGGSAWWKDEDRGSNGTRHEAGLGIRFGPTRSANAQIARIDFSWDLNGDGSPVITAITRGFF